jgi:putative transposase
LTRYHRCPTDYKIFDRYKDCGLDALTDRSRRPYRQANQLPMQIEKLIVGLKNGTGS